MYSYLFDLVHSREYSDVLGNFGKMKFECKVGSVFTKISSTKSCVGFQLNELFGYICLLHRKMFKLFEKCKRKTMESNI